MLLPAPEFARLTETSTHSYAKRTMHRSRALTVSILGGLAAGAVAAAPLSAAAAPAYGFARPQYVDMHLAGGEPLIFADARHGTLIYSSHEGTTHLYRPGLTGSPAGDKDFGANYRNQVNVWVSNDRGATWRQVDWMGTGFVANPLIDNGFSDPDLTQDEAGNVYDTGINLANDSLFASADGGYHWTRGTAQCHDGDRPWLAGARANHVYLATDTVEGSGSGHQVFLSTDGGQTCSPTGISDNGPTTDGGSYSGFGKLYFDHRTGNLVEPAVFMDRNGSTDGVGVSILRPGAAAFQPIKVAGTSMYGHWPAIAIDAASNIYLTWDTDDRVPNTSSGCDGNNTPAANSIKLAVSHDQGKTWSVSTVAHPGTRVLWPWIAAGDAGKASVVWYQTDKLIDPDCQPSNVYVMAAFVQNAAGSHPSAVTVNASGRPIHYGGVCQEGTDCVVNGKDRRLGDYFTNAIDWRGCVLIATGDTMLKDEDNGSELPTSRPVFIAQNAGPALVGNGSCAKT